MAKWIDAGPLSDFPPGSQTCVTLENLPVVIFNTAGVLRAAANVCPHAGMPIGEGELAGSVLTCPYHGYSFDIQTGRNVDYPDDSPLPLYPVRVEAGRILVNLQPEPKPT